MTASLILMVVFAIQLALSVAIYHLNDALDNILTVFKQQDTINHTSFESIQILANRLDLVEKSANDIEGIQHICAGLQSKCDVQEVQILNLNNKTAVHSTAIRKLQDSCLEVK